MQELVKKVLSSAQGLFDTAILSVELNLINR